MRCQPLFQHWLQLLGRGGVLAADLIELGPGYIKPYAKAIRVRHVLHLTQSIAEVDESEGVI